MAQPSGIRRARARKAQDSRGLFIGDIDEYFSLRSARDTERAMREAGHPVTLTVLRRHGHGYARVAAQVNDAAWQLFETTALPFVPRFIQY